MNILITGSSGFLGSHSVNYFRALGHTVVGVDITPGLTTDIVEDIRTYLIDASDKYDLLLHYAAEVKGRANIEKNYLNMIANIDIDRVVFNWAMNHVRHIIYPSSCAVYPTKFQNSPNTPLIENMIDFSSDTIGVSDHLYGWCKLTAERMLWQIHQETDLCVHIIRPFSGYGPGQSRDYPMANLVNMIKNNPNDLQVWGDGFQTRDWVHVDDIMRTIDWCTQDHVRYRTLNIGTGHATTFSDLIKQIYNVVYDQPCPLIKQLPNTPSGVQHRLADTQLQQELNILPKISLLDGIKTLL